jgi:N-alpha-acetyl-L-2,4-diaminobutyrate deacetylase
MIPITVIKNGDGPTALLTGANHGDEYEGPIALRSCARSETRRHHRPRDHRAVHQLPGVSGRHAHVADRRGNLNRCFPGADGTVTEKIADYFMPHLLPHGRHRARLPFRRKTLDFIPFAAAHVARRRRCSRRLRGGDGGVQRALFDDRMREIDNVGMYDTAARSAGQGLRDDRTRRRRHGDGANRSPSRARACATC